MTDDKPKKKQPRNRGKGRRFKLGESGNPKGRPKRPWTWGSLFAEATEKSKEKGAPPAKQLIADALVAKALKGDVMAFNAIADRMDGKPHQTIAQTNETRAEIVVLGGPKDD